MKDNRGFSLIELIVVMAIIALLIGGTAIGIRILSYTDTEKITKTVDQSLHKLRIDTMSKGNLYHYLFIAWNDTKEEYEIGYVTGTVALNGTNWDDGSVSTISNRKGLCSSKVTISYSDHSIGSDLQEISTSNDVLLLQYYVHSGAFQSNCRMISIVNGSKNTSIHLVGKTGKHYTL